MGWINRIESNRICLVPIKGPCKELCALQSNTIISKTHKTTQLQGQGRARKYHVNIKYDQFNYLFSFQLLSQSYTLDTNATNMFSNIEK